MRGGGGIDNVTNEEMLQYLISENIIDTTTILESIMANKRKEILKKHPCRIWQGKTNGMWYTYIPLENGKRRQIAKKTLKEVEDVIIEHYKDEPSVNEIFNRWIDEKMHYGEISEASRDRYVADFKRFFDDTKLKYKKIQNVSETELEEHIKDQILIHNLTSKAYGGLRTIIIGVWGYAYRYKYTSIAIRTFFTEMRLSSKIFNHKTKLAEEEVFTDQEVGMVKDYLLNNKPNVISYGIILGMRTGLRVGELCSLMWEDVSDHCLRICKTETRHRVRKGEYTREIKNNAKTDAGNRYVLIDDEAVEVLKEIKKRNPNGKYLFEINGTRCIGQSFTRKLERACNTLKITPRSMHKCRKTYITTLINANVPESLIIEQVGHTDIKTSKQYYLFNNKAKQEALKTLSEAIS